MIVFYFKEIRGLNLLAKISIIVPVYNAEKYLKGAMQCLIN